jgi:DNA-binding CsgD family transcriptional regulator
MVEETAPSDRRPRTAPARLSWPVITRAAEDRAVAVVCEHRWSVALVGAAGLGKTTVAARVTDRVITQEDAAHPLVVPITAVAAGSSMPFGAVSDRFGDVLGDDLTEPVPAEERLRDAGETEGRDLLLRVDDAELLDALSARYVAWLVRDQHARLVLTCRDFTALAEPLRALWQDDLLERIDLEPLDLAETSSLVERALGAPLEPASVEQVHRATQGNPLHLREVVRAGLSSGALEHTALSWYWRGRVTASLSLTDMYRTELAALPSVLRDVVEIVALAEPIPLPRLLALVDGTDLDRAVGLGFVRIDSTDTGSPVARSSHPLVGEVVRTQVPVARRTALFARANAFRTDRPEGAPPAARLRATLWSLECGIVPPVEQLLDAARIAVGLQEHESAITLTTAALATTATLTPTDRVRTHCLRSLAHGYSRGREAGRLDAEAAWGLVTSGTPVDDIAVVEACETLANLRQFHDDDTAASVALTDAAVRFVGPETVEQLRVLRLSHLGWGGEFAEIRQEIERTGVLHAPVIPRSFLPIAACAVAALGIGGRLDDAVRLAQACLATATVHLEDSPWSLGEIVSVMHQVQVWRGDIAEMVTQVPVSRSDPFLKYDFTLELFGIGNQALGQRRWADAVTAFTAACERYAVADPGGFAAYAWSRLALSQAHAGMADAAAESVERARSTPLRAMRILGDEVEMTIAWAEALLGNPAGLQRADEVIARGTASGAWTHVLAGQTLHHAVDVAAGRDGAGSLARMQQSAARVDGPVSRAVTAYADAVHSGDRRCIASALADLAACGISLTARRRTQPLTKREYEVARLAAQGFSNRRIAEHLGLSVRTIDAHMSRVFAKWDLHARSELADLV